MRMAKVDEVRIDGLSYNQEHFKAMMNMQAHMEKSKYFYELINTGTFEEVVPKHHHNFKDMFGEEFQALPE
jgi:ligand-binding SRPBCC domain-containing protein